MITTRHLKTTLVCLAALAISTVCDSPVSAAENHLRPAPKRPSQSLVKQAAHGRLSADMPERPLDGSLVRGRVPRAVQHVGFLDGGCDNGCGPACDCDAGPGCGSEASCGFEAACGLEASCGVEPTFGEPTFGEPMFGEPTCGMEAYGECSCDACGGVSSIPVFLPLLRVNWNRFQFFAGVQGFQGPLSFASTTPATPDARSGSGSFGFFQGFNEGRSLKRLFGWDIAAQLGVRAAQSNLDGSEFTGDTRNQVFVTGGLFRRVDYGLQYGTVIDYLSDDWYFQGDLTQIRSELSWKTNEAHTFGIQTMFALSDDNSDTIVRTPAGTTIRGNIEFESTDQYRIFYRRLLAGSGDWTAFGGWTEDSDTILGASLNLPLRQKLMLSTGATFLIPDDTRGLDHRDEGWNISLGLVYRPGGPNGCGRYCRPLFDVADNGTFMVDQK